MNPSRQHTLVRRVLAHLDHGTTDCDPTPTTIPVASYRDGARDAQLFAELPLAIGHVSQLPNVGDFFTHDATGVPLLVVRDDDGIHAVVNVCRHRGTRVERAACGTKQAFVCPYHAWSYGRDGTRLGAPHAHGFDGLPRRDLARVPIAEMAGLLVIRPRADWLGELADDLAGFGLASGHIYAPQVQTRALSWQLAIDVFLEAYHLRPTHKQSIFPMFFDNTGLVDRVGPHLRNVFPKRTIRELANQPHGSWELRRHANVLFHIFPNTLVLVEPDHAAVLHLWPQGIDRTLLTSYTIVPESPTTDKARAYWDANNAILYNAIAEDFAMGESIQSGLASGANADVAFGTFEHALTHFHRQIATIA